MYAIGGFESMFFAKKAQCEMCSQTVSEKDSKELKQGYICEDCYTNLLNSSIINRWVVLKELTILDIKELIDKNNKDVEIVQIVNPSLLLKEGEICYYAGKAKSYNVKNVITHYKSTGGFAGFRIMKGVSIGRTQSTRIPIREDVEETYPAKFFITNKRIVLIADKFGFDLDINKVSSVDLFRNGFKFTYKDKPRYVLTNDYNYILKLCVKLSQIV